MTTRLASINLEVASPERSRAFYVDVLGMVEDRRRSQAPSFIYLTSPGCDITLACARTGSGAVPSPTMEIGFEVDDIEAMKGHLAALGVLDRREESMGWGHAIEMKDHDGHRVVVYAFAKGEGSDGR